MGWELTQSSERYGVVVCDYSGNVNEQDLTLSLGDTVEILERNGDWFRGRINQRGDQRLGLFPANHICLQPCQVVGTGPQQHVVPKQDPLIIEVAAVLTEWNVHLKQLYMSKNLDKYEKLRTAVKDLITARMQLILGNLPTDHAAAVKSKITDKIDWGNAELELDLIPRDKDGAVMHADTAGVMQLYHVHKETASVERSASISLSNRRSTRGDMRRGTSSNTFKHIILRHKIFIYSLAAERKENLHLYYSLYDADSGDRRGLGGFINESFVLHLGPNCQPVGVSDFSEVSSVFTNVPVQQGSTQNSIVSRKLYLVCHIFRRGSIDGGKAKKSSGATDDKGFQRPVACGVLPLIGMLAQSDADAETEASLELFTFKGDESSFPTLHEHIISESSSKYQPLDTTSTLKVDLRFLTGPLAVVRKDHPLVFKNPNAAPIGFGDVIQADAQTAAQVRNDLYVTLHQADFEKGAKSTPRNVEATLTVVDNESGKQLPDCIYIGAGLEPVSEYQSTIYYHTNQPVWHETVKVTVPPLAFEKAHLKVIFKHCSTSSDKSKSQAFCFSHIPLMSEKSGIAIKDDDQQQIDVFKYEAKNDKPGKPWYRVDPNQLKRQVKDKLILGTMLCSTKLTQDPRLLALLRWRENCKPMELKEALRTLTYVEPAAIVKFLTDIFDALFGILDKYPDLAADVFSAVVHIIKTADDSKRFSNFKQVLEAYIADHFCSTNIHGPLVAQLQKHVESVLDPTFGKELNTAIDELDYLFKFIIRSHDLDMELRPGTRDDLKHTLKAFFAAIDKMMGEPNPVAAGSKSKLLRSYAFVLQELTSIFTDVELGEIARRFVDSIRQLPGETDKIRDLKLDFISDLVEGALYSTRPGRQILNQSLTNIMKDELSSGKKLTAVISITDNILSSLHRAQDRNDDDILEVARPLLAKLATESVKKGETRGHITSCLCGLLRIMSSNHYKQLVSELGRGEVESLLGSLMEAFSKSADNSVFPRDWLVMQLVLNDVVLDASKEISDILMQSFLNGKQFHLGLWKMWFQMGQKYASQTSLQVENFADTKRLKVLASRGDRRELMASQVVKLWAALKEHHVVLIDKVVGPIQRLALIPNRTVRRLILPLFFDMIATQVEHKSNFDGLHKAVIDNLDRSVTDGAGDSEYSVLFETILMGLSNESGNDVIKTSMPSFIEDVKTLLDLLLHLRDVPDGDRGHDHFKDQRAGCLVDLIQFYERSSRIPMAVKTAERLAAIHLAEHQYIEHAFALHTHAKRCSWREDQHVKSMEDGGKELYPAQSAFHRRAMLYEKIIDAYDKGGAFERALEVSKELAEKYETAIFDYKKLSELLKKRASLLDKIVSGQRTEPQYFRVGYWGRNFPANIRNKEFIYRSANKGDHITVFCDRIQLQFPKAQLLMSPKPITDALRESEDQAIMISKVKAQPTDDNSPFKGKAVSAALKAYYRENEMNQFVFTRPFRKGDKTDNEFETLWTETVIMHTASTLPCEQPRSLIIKTDATEMSPIENAITTMNEKNAELRDAIDEHARDLGLNINPLTMMLNGVIDAAVQGGTEKYREAFFTPKFSKSNPGTEGHVSALKRLIGQQVEILASGVMVHGKKCPPDLRPLQERLEGLVKDMQDKATADAAASSKHKASTSSLPVSKPDDPPVVKNTPPRSVSSVQLTATSSNTPAKTAASSPRPTSKPSQPSESPAPAAKPAASPKPVINIKHANLDQPASPVRVVPAVAAASPPVDPTPPPRATPARSSPRLSVKHPAGKPSPHTPASAPATPKTAEAPPRPSSAKPASSNPFASRPAIKPEEKAAPAVPAKAAPARPTAAKPKGTVLDGLQSGGATTTNPFASKPARPSSSKPQVPVEAGTNPFEAAAAETPPARPPKPASKPTSRTTSGAAS